MGLFGGSKSSKKTTVNQSREDNVATNYAGGNVNLGHTGGSVRITQNDLSAGVANTALYTSRDAMNSAADVAQSAVDANTDTVFGAFDFGADVVSQGNDLARSLFGDALAYGDAAQDRYSDVVGDALSAIDGAGQNISYISGEAIGAVSDTARDAIDVNSATTLSALEMGYAFGNDSLGYYNDIVSDAINAVEWQSQQSTQQIERSLASVDSATTSDSAETLQTVGKWIAGAIAVVGFAAFFRRA